MGQKEREREKINLGFDRRILDKAKTLFSSFKKMHVTSYREISQHFLYEESVEYTQGTGN